MNKFYLLLSLLSLFLLAACGDNSGDSPKDTTPFEIVSSSISEGSVVDPADIDSITLTFSRDVDVVNMNHISLVNNTNSEKRFVQTGSSRGNTFTFPVTLSYDNDYSLTVVSTAAKEKSGSQWVKPFTLKFSTGSYKLPEVSTSAIQPLVNPNATKEAKMIHDYLKSQYGKKMISGAMANVNNNNDFPDWIYKISGKYPAYTCYDFIHLRHSAPGSWINYGDISPAENQWNKGGLVGYGWHWNVPKDENLTDLDARNPFDIDRALTPGTWENKWVEEDVEKVAGYLKLLQDRGIAVLWRPLHEAAGDYKWGAWFWWGMQGVEKTKRLWIWLYDKLTNQYGLNNLIWVWTVQLYREGKLTGMEDLQAAYPGDEYVDIVGPDVYNKTHAASPDFFNIINSLVGGRKIIAMPECGQLPDPEESFQSGACWSYAMLWYTYNIHQNGDAVEDEFNNTTDYIKQWMSSPLVLTRSDLPGWH